MILTALDERALNGEPTAFAIPCKDCECFRRIHAKGRCHQCYKAKLRRDRGARPYNRHYTAEQVQAVKDFVAAGGSYTAAEAHFGISRSQCHRMATRQQRREVA